MSQYDKNQSLQNALSNASSTFGTSNCDVQNTLIKQVVHALWSLSYEGDDGSAAAVATIATSMR